MWNRPSEIDLDVADLTATKSEDLGVAKTRAVNRPSLIGHEHTVASRHQVDEVELAVRSLLGQQRSKYVARLMRLSSGLVKWKSSAISRSSADRSLVTYAL